MLQIAQSEPTAALRRIPFVLELPADRNEVQTINLGDIDTGDSFTLTFDGQTTGSISHSADMASAIDTALEALSNIAASDLTVVKGTGHVYAVTFGGSLAATDVPLMTITPTGFTPTGITETLHGGIAGAPARNVTLEADEIRVSLNGAANADSDGTVAEVGHGLYYYVADTTEVGTLGFLALTILREDLAMTYGVAQIVSASSSLGAPVIRSGTADAGATGSLTLDSEASSVTNFYVPSLVYLRSGTGAGQARIAHAYNGTTKVLSVEPSWATVPDNTTVFDLLPVEPSMADLTRTNHEVSGTFGGDLATPEDVADGILPTVDQIKDKTDLMVFVNGAVKAYLAQFRAS